MQLTRAVLIVVVILSSAIQAFAQETVLVRARTAATSGRRAEALAMLETHLAETPRDVDARLLYGLVLSWDGRYDEARRALQQVLTQTPGYTDARVALMNVEYWSGDSTAALEQANQVLARNPGNVTARTVRDRLEAAARPWWANTSYTFDTFNDERDPWQEFMVYLTRRTPVGSVIGRFSVADRFAESDQLLEIDFYPRFRPGTYAYINAGAATKATLYPNSRFGFDLYQSIGRGFEVSGGARYLDFGELTQIYVATLTKYVGNWMFTGKVYRVPAEGLLDSTSYHGLFRRYFGGDGTNYAGLGYSHGLSREEVRSQFDLLTLRAHTIRGEFDVLAGKRLRVFASGSTSRQERVSLVPLWQTTISSGISVQF